MSTPLLARLGWRPSVTRLRKSFYGQKTDVTKSELDCILKYLDMFERPMYVEIGVYFGGTFAAVLRHLQLRTVHYRAIGVDLFEDLAHETRDPARQAHDIVNKYNILNAAYKEELEVALQHQGLAQFELRLGQSHEVVAQIDELADVFFIDGNHRYQQTMLDAQACLNKAKVGSYLIFHNASTTIPPDPQYVSFDGGPWKVCEELSADRRLEYVELVGRCAVLRVVAV